MNQRKILMFTMISGIFGGVLMLRTFAQAPAAPAPAAAPATQPAGEKTTTPSGLQIIAVGKGTGVKNNDTVWVHYAGRVKDGAEFDNSHKHPSHEPIRFIIGTGQVIKGWDEGLLGMQIGEKRQLTVPPDLAYGAEGRPPAIPANSTLVFDVELVGVLRGE